MPGRIWLSVCVLTGLSGCALPRSQPAVVPTAVIMNVQTSAGPLPVRDHVYPGQGVIRQAIVTGPVAPPSAPVRPDGTTGYDLLALSGGGSNGAFGAGVLCGWTQAGTRPTFQVVTGISTGALLASFAFAGPQFDPQLRTAYTTVESSQIFRRNSLMQLPWSDSLCRTDPLKEMIAHYADDPLLKAIADGYRQGRRLYVGTTHLDQKRLIIWDMGSIAACGHPGAPQLFRAVLRASTSIPVLFNPAEFQVQAETGKWYSELHVDGGGAARSSCGTCWCATWNPRSPPPARRMCAGSSINRPQVRTRTTRRPRTWTCPARGCTS